MTTDTDTTTVALNFVLNALAENGGWSNFDESLAANPNTPTLVLHGLAHSVSMSTRRNVAANVNTLAGTLSEIWEAQKVNRNGSDRWLIEALRENPNTPASVVSDIENSCSPGW